MTKSSNFVTTIQYCYCFTVAYDYKACLNLPNSFRLYQNNVGGKMKVNLNEYEAAEMYGPSVSWFRRARWTGNGPRYIKLGARVLYSLEELDRYFAARVRSSTSDPGEKAG